MSAEHPHKHGETPTDIWAVEARKITEILAETERNGSIQGFYERMEGREKMSPRTGEVMEILCMDGRFNESNKPGHVFVRDGGSGILREGEGVVEVAAGYVQAAIDLQVSEIRFTSHDGCGAWGLSGKDTDDGKDYYKLLVKEIEAQITEKKLQIKVVQDHITDDLENNEEGCGLAEGHAETVTYYAYVPSFNPQEAKGMPSGFVISREYFSGEYCESNVAVAIKIAFGGHGEFAENFSESTPFLLVAVADSEEKMTEAKDELERAKKQGIEEYLLHGLKGKAKDDAREEFEEKIKVTGFLVDNKE
jgi:hypothetical protein